MPILLNLFIALPIIEIYVLISVGSIMGAFPTIIIILLTAVIGYRLFKAQGNEKLHNIRSAMSGARRQQGESLAMDLAEGAAILVAGVLLLTPGFVTDAFGFACLFPPTRKAMIKALGKRSIIHVQTSSSFHGQNVNAEQQKHSSKNSGNVIEGEYREKD